MKLDTCELLKRKYGLSLYIFQHYKYFDKKNEFNVKIDMHLIKIK